MKNVLDEVDLSGLTLKKWVILEQKMIIGELDASSVDESDIKTLTSRSMEFLTKH